MKKIKQIFLFLGVFLSGLFSAQIENINPGEVLNYRIHYGFITAGNAQLTASRVVYNNKPHLKVTGIGKTTGAANTFFPVYDVYQSYIDMATGLPSFYVRNVSEGKYRRHFETTFNHQNQTLQLHNKLEKTSKNYKSIKGIQDMLSSFYYLRSQNRDNFKVGSVVRMNVWIDDESYPFMLRVAGTEVKNTKFGKINCLKIIPSVMSGRVFKAKEGVTLWVSNDDNLVPVEIKAELAVGSLKASIDSYKNTKTPLKFY